MENGQDPHDVDKQPRSNETSLPSEADLPRLNEGAERFDEHSYPGKSDHSSKTRGAGRPDGILRRVFAVLRFERGIFERIGEDPRATFQALVVFAVTNILPEVRWLVGPATAESRFSEWEAVAAPVWSSGTHLAVIDYLRTLDPQVSLVLLFIAEALVLLVDTMALAGIAKLLVGRTAKGDPRTASWVRAFLFTSAPNALVPIPRAGWALASAYIVLLRIVAIRDLARIPLSRAILWMVVSVVVYGFLRRFIFLLIYGVVRQFLVLMP